MPRRRTSQSNSQTLPRSKERVPARTAPESEPVSNVNDAFDSLNTGPSINETEKFLPFGLPTSGEWRSASSETGTQRAPVIPRQASPAESHNTEPGPRLLAQIGNDFNHTTFERHAALLGDSRLSQPSARRQRAMIAQQLQRDYGNRYVQRLVEHIERKKNDAIGAEGGEAGPEVESAIAQDKGHGRVLHEDIKTPMENSFETDFSDVRVHDDPHADILSEALNARAFTAGRDIFFKRGEYNPGSRAGKETIAHELTHVVQQNGNQRNVVERAPQEDETGLDDSAIETPESGVEQDMTASAENATEPITQTAGHEPSETASTNGEAAAPGGVPQTPTPKADTSSALSANGASPGSTSEATYEEEEVDFAEESFAPASGEPVMAGASGGEMPDGADGFGDLGGDEEAQSCSLDDNLPAVMVIEHLVSIAKGQAAHPPAEEIAAEAKAAAEPPTDEAKGQAAAAQMEKMSVLQPQPFDPSSLNSVLKDGLGDMTPGTLGEMDGFKKGNKLRSLKGPLVDVAGQGAKRAKSGFEETTEEKPDPGAVKPQPFVPLQPLEPPPPPPEVNASAATPVPRPVSDATDPLIEAVQEIEQEMEDAGVTEEMLERSNEPSFLSALNLLNLAKGAIAQTPEEHMERQQAIVSKAQDIALKVAQSGINAIRSVGEQIYEQVSGIAGEVVGNFEEARAEIFGHIEAIYVETRKTVEACLSRIDTEAVIAVQKGVTDAQEAFENYVDRKMEAYKENRYSGTGGKARWVRDQVLGPPLEVSRFYIQGRALYIRRILALSGTVALVIQQAIADARAAIAEGTRRIHEYIINLPAHLIQVGIEAALTIGKKFMELEQKIKDMLRRFVDMLIQKYYEVCNLLEKAVEFVKSGVGGLVEAAIDAIMPIIKTIIQLAGMLLRVVEKAESVIGIIIDDPATFIANLIDALLQGFNRFMSKVVTYVKDGLIEWLTGSVGDLTSRFEIPEKWDLQGVFGFVLQVLGYTYENIRSMAVGVFGERAVKVLETAFEIFKVLKNDGVAGLWDYIESKATSVIDQVMSQIQGTVIVEVVKAGIKWLIKFILSALIPGAGWVPVAFKVIDIFKFIIEDGAEMIDLVDSILNSITAIAQGKIGGAAKLVEQSLADSVPVLISFLARMIGLGGIADKVQKILQLPQKPIEMAMEWVFKMGKKFIAMLMGKGKTEEEGAEGESEESGPEVQAGLAAIDAEEEEYLEEGMMEKEEAQKVAAAIESKHSVFKSIEVIEGEGTWDYRYKVNAPEEDEEVAEAVQRKPAEHAETLAQGDDVVPDTEEAIQSSRGQGEPLPEPLRASMQGGFGADFSGVSVHDDQEADDLSDSLNARAFTVGRDIYFGRGEYEPESTEGQETIAHELTHVLQQNGSEKAEESRASLVQDHIQRADGDAKVKEGSMQEEIGSQTGVADVIDEAADALILILEIQAEKEYLEDYTLVPPSESEAEEGIVAVLKPKSPSESEAEGALELVLDTDVTSDAVEFIYEVIYEDVNQPIPGGAPSGSELERLRKENIDILEVHEARQRADAKSIMTNVGILIGGSLPVTGPIVNGLSFLIDSKAGLDANKASEHFMDLAIAARNGGRADLAKAAEYAAQKLQRKFVRKSVSAGLGGASVAAWGTGLVFPAVAPAAGVVGAGLTAGSAVSAAEPAAKGLYKMLRDTKGKHRIMIAKQMWQWLWSNDGKEVVFAENSLKILKLNPQRLREMGRIKGTEEIFKALKST